MFVSNPPAPYICEVKMKEQINNPENQFFCYRSCNEIFFSGKDVGVVSQFISSCSVDTFVNLLLDIATQKMKFSIKDLFSKYDQILNGKLHFLCSVCNF